MNKKFKIVFLFVLILAIAVLGYFLGKNTQSAEKAQANYQAVQLISGEVYFGHLSFFPKVKLTNVHFLQQVPAPEEQEDQEPQTQLVSLNSLYFKPVNVMYLQKDQILWWTDLAQDSQIIQLIEGKK